MYLYQCVWCAVSDCNKPSGNVVDVWCVSEVQEHLHDAERGRDVAQAVSVGAGTSLHSVSAHRPGPARPDHPAAASPAR